MPVTVMYRNKVEGVKMVFFVNCFAEILKDVGQQRDVRKKIVVVIILEGIHL